MGHTFLILGTLIIPAYLSWGRRQRSWKNWDCLDDAKGRTKRVCLTDDAEIPQGYYQITNKREVFKSTPKTETRCEKAAGKSFCPKTCADGSFCFEQICRPFHGESIKGYRGTFYTNRKDKCRCFIPRVN